MTRGGTTDRYGRRVRFTLLAVSLAFMGVARLIEVTGDPPNPSTGPTFPNPQPPNPQPPPPPRPQTPPPHPAPQPAPMPSPAPPP